MRVLQLDLYLIHSDEISNRGQRYLLVTYTYINDYANFIKFQWTLVI